MVVERREAPGGEDPIVDSPWTLHPGLEAEVSRWTGYWTGRGREEFEIYLERMTVYEALVDRSLARRGLPPSLRYLPIIESGYTVHAVSRASAVGLWQLMAPTARGAGMRVSSLVDERRDPVEATSAALAFLEHLHARYGSWFLALAAYNAGPGRIDRILDRHAGGATGSDGIYWHIRPHLPRETRHFVPRFLAAARLASRPEAHGLGVRRSSAGPLEWEEVWVPDATSLDVVAEAAGVLEEEVAFLNPHILRRVTPWGVRTRLRLPTGTASRFQRAYAALPPDQRVSVTEHAIEPGDTLWDLARRYGVALDTLREANPSVRPERLRPGDVLVVPLGRSGRR
jgi:membrane-bound lytic murein transglycosylase D